MKLTVVAIGLLGLLAVGVTCDIFLFGILLSQVLTKHNIKINWKKLMQNIVVLLGFLYFVVVTGIGLTSIQVMPNNLASDWVQNMFLNPQCLTANIVGMLIVVAIILNFGCDKSISKLKVIEKCNTKSTN